MGHRCLLYSLDFMTGNPRGARLTDALSHILRLLTSYQQKEVRRLLKPRDAETCLTFQGINKLFTRLSGAIEDFFF